MKPRNVVEFSYDVRAEAIRFFNNVEKYINLITTDLQKKGVFNTYCRTTFYDIRREVEFMKSSMIFDGTSNMPGFIHHPQIHIDIIEKMWGGIGTLLFNKYFSDLDDGIKAHMIHIKRSYIEFINSCKINAEIEEED